MVVTGRNFGANALLVVTDVIELTENCKVDQLAVIALKMKISELLSSPF